MVKPVFDAEQPGCQRLAQPIAEVAEEVVFFLRLLMDGIGVATGLADPVGELIEDAVDVPAGPFEVILEGVGGQPDAEGLVLATFGAGEHRAAGRKFGDFITVCMELLGLPGDATEECVGEPGPELADREPADLGRVHLLDLAAERVGDELGTQADADDREPGLVGGFDERAFLVDPGVFVGLIDIHRPAHGDDAVHIIQVGGDGVAGVEPDGPQAVAVVTQDLSQACGGFHRVVLKDDDRHIGLLGLVVGGGILADRDRWGGGFSRGLDRTADNYPMPTPHALILHSGGPRSLVATALMIENDEKTRLSLLYINDGRDNAPHRLDYTHRQAEHFAVTRVQQLDMPHLYGHGQGKNPDGAPMGPLVVPQVLLASLASARLHQAGHVIWPASFNADIKAIAKATEQVILADQSGDADLGDTPRIDTPLLELSDHQLIELGEELQVPWAFSWSCVGSAELPCRACPGCRRRKAAFQTAGVIDPIEKPAGVMV
jgi:7-cyano-7-deazaguanine synthase